MCTSSGPSANRSVRTPAHIPASGLVQVGSYFLAKRDDLLVGNQIDGRKNAYIPRPAKPKPEPEPEPEVRALEATDTPPFSS